MGAARQLFVVGKMGDVVRDDSLDGEEEGSDAGVTSGGGLAQDRDDAGEEDEAKEENGADEDDGEDELARREGAAATGCGGCGGRQGGWRGRDHWRRWWHVWDGQSL